MSHDPLAKTSNRRPEDMPGVPPFTATRANTASDLKWSVRDADGQTVFRCQGKRNAESEAERRNQAG